MPRSPKASPPSPTKTRKTATHKPLSSLADWYHQELIQAYPQARCALNHRNAYELLVATILSAQCTDARVNLVTPEFFRRWPDPGSLAQASVSAIESVIHSTGFYRNKAKSLAGTARMLVEKFGGQVPDTMESLLELPGVARKTANVVLGNAYGKNLGIVVDTHVARLSRRLGLTTHKDPSKIEADLQRLFPQAQWTELAHRLIAHGRKICRARRPNCMACMLQTRCPRVGL